MLDLVKRTDQLKTEAHTFWLSTDNWRAFQTRAALSWQSVRFRKPAPKTLPDEPGIYAFVVEPRPFNFPPHGYPLYVGITGSGSKGTLSTRYRHYFREQRKVIRPPIHYMLNKWKGYLYFYYAIIKDRRISLRKLELCMNDSLRPPFVQNDFTAAARRATKVARI